jgi:cytochrome c oxidase subunit 1
MGAVLIVLSVLTLIVNFLTSRRSGALAGPNPWGADTLEWTLSSPPPSYNFLHIPIVTSANAAWSIEPEHPYVTGLRFDSREVLVTKTLDADPSHVEELPGHSIAPFLLAIMTTGTLIGSIFYAWYFSLGLIPVGLVLVYWFWPKPEQIREHVLRERGSDPLKPALTS